MVIDRKPLPIADTPLWQDRAARAVHYALYVALIGMFASGIGMIV